MSKKTKQKHARHTQNKQPAMNHLIKLRLAKQALQKKQFVREKKCERSMSEVLCFVCLKCKAMMSVLWCRITCRLLRLSSLMGSTSPRKKSTMYANSLALRLIKYTSYEGDESEKREKVRAIYLWSGFGGPSLRH